MREGPREEMSFRGVCRRESIDLGADGGGGGGDGRTSPGGGRTGHTP